MVEILFDLLNIQLGGVRTAVDAAFRKHGQFIQLHRITDQIIVNTHRDINYRPGLYCQSESENKSEIRPKVIIRGPVHATTLTISAASRGY
jgi:hypothetical protein